MSYTDDDTICAIATPPGRGGVGIVRVSGKDALAIAKELTSITPQISTIQYGHFKNKANEVIDTGLILSFKGPKSFTGEDVVEFHGHGGPVVMDLLLERIVGLGARLAGPGEFSKRAFLNDKIDLLQAEAISDLISAQSMSQVRLAQRSLQGDFSNSISAIVDDLIKLRVYVEAALDFPEEEIDFLASSHISEQLEAIISQIKLLKEKAAQGAILRDGVNVVIAGRPNAGKSTLINRLSGSDTAIVTDIPGTTRDIIKEDINMDGLMLHVLDTAGLRESDDDVEREGIRRAEKAIQEADLVLLVIDGSDYSQNQEMIDEFHQHFNKNTLTIVNKIDLSEAKPNLDYDVAISAKEARGIETLKVQIKNKVGLAQGGEEHLFLARRRHLDAIDKSLVTLTLGLENLSQHRAGELLAEDLRLAQEYLSEITGEFSADDLLGEIFSSFCIGK